MYVCYFKKFVTLYYIVVLPQLASYQWATDVTAVAKRMGHSWKPPDAHRITATKILDGPLVANLSGPNARISVDHAMKST